jgi:hypothetical protein
MSRRTSPEFLQILQHDNQIPDDAKETIRQFLERSDAFKFAHIDGTREDNAWLLEQARQFVKQTAAARNAESEKPDADPPDPGSDGNDTSNPPTETGQAKKDEKAEPAHA